MPDQTSGADQTLDLSVIDSLRELGGADEPGLVTELIGIFLQDAPQRMHEIESGLRNGDLRLVERAAHTLKSSSANIGAMALSGLCKRMEENVRNAAASEVPELVRASGRELDVVREALLKLKS